ncbi:MAG: AmiS/UreI family transporter [Acidimicrobiia bacterium]
MGPVVLLAASFLFLADSAFLFGKAEAKGMGAVNAVLGGLMAIMGLQIGFTANGEAFSLILSTLSLTFATFYLVLAWSLLGGFALKGLGWYCLGAGLWVLISAFYFFVEARDNYFGVFALVWSILFLAAWGNLSYDNARLGKVVRWILGVGSIITLMIPAYLLIVGQWPPF